jgi:hypothetical protein
MSFPAQAALARAAKPGQFPMVEAFVARIGTMRFFGGVAPLDGAWRAMATLTGAGSLLGFSMFSAIERASVAWIGRLGPWRPGGARGRLAGR